MLRVWRDGGGGPWPEGDGHLSPPGVSSSLDPPRPCPGRSGDRNQGLRGEDLVHSHSPRGRRGWNSVPHPRPGWWGPSEGIQDGERTSPESSVMVLLNCPFPPVPGADGAAAAGGAEPGGFPARLPTRPGPGPPEADPGREAAGAQESRASLNWHGMQVPKRAGDHAETRVLSELRRALAPRNRSKQPGRFHIINGLPHSSP